MDVLQNARLKYSLSKTKKLPKINKNKLEEDTNSYNDEAEKYSPSPSVYNATESIHSMAAASYSKAQNNTIKRLYNKNPQLDISTLVHAKARLQRILQKPDLF